MLFSRNYTNFTDSSSTGTNDINASSTGIGSNNHIFNADGIFIGFSVVIGSLLLCYLIGLMCSCRCKHSPAPVPAPVIPPTATADDDTAEETTDNNYIRMTGV